MLPPTTAWERIALTDNSAGHAIIAAVLAQEIVKLLGLVEGAHVGDFVSSSKHGCCVVLELPQEVWKIVRCFCDQRLRCTVQSGELEMEAGLRGA